MAEAVSNLTLVSVVSGSVLVKSIGFERENWILFSSSEIAGLCCIMSSSDDFAKLVVIP